ncbi:MAG: ribonuclease III [Clostridia bacterium]|nr:ribonuclease III [Clostridia bacterium]
MTEFEKKIGYEFKNKKLLTQALTHSSYANERKVGNNERLEFLGDSVLGFITAEYLFTRLKGSQEGSLSKLRASLVCEQSLYDISKKIDLSRYILLGHGEELGGGRERPSVVSDAFEAVLAAIYLDAGLDFAREWLLGVMSDAFEDAISGNRSRDYKTELQEYLQHIKRNRASYRVASESGPDHNKYFEIEVVLDGRVLARAGGTSKKEAEQNAAQLALKKL